MVESVNVQDLYLTKCAAFFFISVNLSSEQKGHICDFRGPWLSRWRPHTRDTFDFLLRQKNLKKNTTHSLKKDTFCCCVDSHGQFLTWCKTLVWEMQREAFS